MFKVFFEHQNCLIFDIAGREVLRVKIRGKSFSFDPTEEKNVAYYTQANLTELWHKRLGHCHLERMLKIQKNDMSPGVPTLSVNLSNCNACQFGKQNRKSFPKSFCRASQKLQLIHTDVAGP